MYVYKLCAYTNGIMFLAYMEFATEGNNVPKGKGVARSVYPVLCAAPLLLDRLNLAFPTI